MVFHYLIIQMKDLSREEFLALREPALWPLALLTKGKVDRILIEEMFADLRDQKLYSTLPIGHMVAAWFLRDEDLSWLHKEYQKMFEFFKDSPAIQWMEEGGRADERRKADERVLAEQKKAELQLRTAEKKAELRLLDAEKKALAFNRQAIMDLIGTRFPGLLQLARTQVRLLKHSERCYRIIVQVAVVRTIEEARDVLDSITVTEKEQE